MKISSSSSSYWLFENNYLDNLSSQFFSSTKLEELVIKEDSCFIGKLFGEWLSGSSFRGYDKRVGTYELKPSSKIYSPVMHE